MEDIFETRTDLSSLNAAVERIRAALGKIIIGQQDLIDFLIAGILADGHMLIEVVPGVAKTLTARLLAKCIDARFSRIQFTPDLMPSDVLGTSVFNLQRSTFQLNKILSVLHKDKSRYLECNMEALYTNYTQHLKAKKFGYLRYKL